MVSLLSGALYSLDKTIVEFLVIVDDLQPKSLIVLDEIFDIVNLEDLLLECVLDLRVKTPMVTIQDASQVLDVLVWSKHLSHGVVKAVEEKRKIESSLTALERDLASFLFVDLALVLELLVLEVKLRNLLEDP